MKALRSTLRNVEAVHNRHTFATAGGVVEMDGSNTNNRRGSGLGGGGSRGGRRGIIMLGVAAVVVVCGVLLVLAVVGTDNSSRYESTPSPADNASGKGSVYALPSSLSDMIRRFGSAAFVETEEAAAGIERASTGNNKKKVPRDLVPVCGLVDRATAAQYTDLQSYPLRTPDLAIDSLIVMRGGGGDGGEEGRRKSGDGTARIIRNDSSEGDSTINSSTASLVLCRRNRPPYQWAIPGGYVEVGETVEHAVVRETLEETGLRIEGMKLFGIYSHPQRDQRRQTVSVVYRSVASYIASSSSSSSSSDLSKLPGNNAPLALSSASVFDREMTPMFVEQVPKGRDDVAECVPIPIKDLQRMMASMMTAVSDERGEIGGNSNGGASSSALSFHLSRMAFDHAKVVKDFVRSLTASSSSEQQPLSDIEGGVSLA